MILEVQSKYAVLKGLNLLGTGDFSHPTWLSELRSKLKDAGNGLFSFGGITWILTNEVCTVYEQDNKIRKVHHVIHAPSFDVVDQINEQLSKFGSLSSDGRPVFNMTSPQLVELLINVSKDVLVYPAHVWTSWFGCLGSMSGFDSIAECYQDQTKRIYALETGLSSDPGMNWRVSSLDKFTLISNSDSHSPYPWRLGRECNVFEIDKLTYQAINDAIKNKDSKRFLMTLEFFPEEGKYHWDGHRNCGISMSPQESERVKNKCQNCGRDLTIGVLHRVEQLADRPQGFVPPNAIPFKNLVPLHEILAKVLHLAQLSSPRIWREYEKLIAAFGNELAVLLEAPRDQLEKISGEKIADAILKNRHGQIKIRPGYDGVYGEPVFDETAVETERATQRNLAAFAEKTEGPIPA